MTGPIIFANETARGQLEEEGQVVTFRQSDRTVGKTWYRYSRTGPKQGDVRVSLITGVDPRNDLALDPVVSDSGFDSIADWQSAISGVNGEMPDSGYLYLVELLTGDA